ncbi:hypothetical protein [Paenibacillus polymyxa]|uniref:hypothetical protein n=1 Tax=Paenibacillus polymyxa TaxID=1406 RepID=UPI0008D5DE5A|nr:hypothetical protein [Paenibacillus polymyxa]SEI74571.1 hypothetical protein SAMN04488600_101566 [Paenibacillus polymyxa]
MSLLDNMNFSLGDEKRNITIVFKGEKIQVSQNVDNSVKISGGNNQGSIFAAGSNEFRGTINNISSSDIDELGKLTEKLVAALQTEELDGADNEDIINAVQQVEAETKKEKVNKISLRGILSGIDMVMQNVRNVSNSAVSIYTDWSAHVNSIISSF